jgi:hypothetical protein
MHRNVAIFNAEDIVAACEAALEALENPEKGRGKALGKIFSIEKTPRNGKKGVKYFALCASIKGKRGELAIRFKNEILLGQIKPLEEAAAVGHGSQTEQPSTRGDFPPALVIRKYKIRVEASQDGKSITPKPRPEDESMYFKAIELLDEFFEYEMTRRVEEGELYHRKPSRRVGGGQGIKVSNTKIYSLIQLETRAGETLLNPISRTKMKFDEKGMPQGLDIYDATKPYYCSKTKRRCYNRLTFHGEEVTSRNIHLLRSGSEVSGIATFSAACASSMGLSIPNAVVALIVTMPKANNALSVSDILGENEEEAQRAAEEAQRAEGEKKARAPQAETESADENSSEEGSEGPNLATACVDSVSLDETMEAYDAVF